MIAARHRWIGAAALLVAATVVTPGCLGSAPPAKTYYALQYPRGDQVRIYRRPRYPFTLRVRRFNSSVAYDRQEIAYRENPYEISYYWYRLWVAKPREMLQQMVQQHLRDSNIFREVITRISTDLPRYELVCEIDAIEELNSTEKTWFARLALRCFLSDFESGEEVYQFQFDDRRPVYQRHPRFIVRALSEIMETRMNELATDLDVFLASRHDAPAPPKVERPEEPKAVPLTTEPTPGPDGDGGKPDKDEPRAKLKQAPE